MDNIWFVASFWMGLALIASPISMRCGMVAGGCLAPSDELSEVGVFSPGALPELAFARDARIVQDWLHGPRRRGTR